MKLSIIDAPFPVNSAVVIIKVNSLEDNKTEIEYQGNIDPKPGAEEAMENAFKFAFKDSIQGLEKTCIPIELLIFFQNLNFKSIRNPTIDYDIS